MNKKKVNDVLERLLKRYANEHTYSFQDFDVLDVNTVGREMETPLHMACTRAALDDVRILIEGGANVNARTDIGTTPLMRSIYSKNEEIIALLLNAGADPNLASKFGSSALSIAKSGKDLHSVVELLVKHGAV
jgi:uncharacterized protein